MELEVKVGTVPELTIIMVSPEFCWGKFILIFVSLPSFHTQWEKAYQHKLKQMSQFQFDISE